MLCIPCKQAGLLLTRIRMTSHLGSSVSPEKLSRLHAACEAPVTCTCQHQTVSYLNRQKAETTVGGIVQYIIDKYNSNWAGNGYTRKYEEQDG